MILDYKLQRNGQKTFKLSLFLQTIIGKLKVSSYKKQSNSVQIASSSVQIDSSLTKNNCNSLYGELVAKLYQENINLKMLRSSLEENC